MTRCTIALERGWVRNKKADDRHVDNDWLVIWWYVAGEAAPRVAVHQVLDLEGHREIAKGTRLAPVVDSIECSDDAAVIATAAIINLNSVDTDRQADEVTAFAREVASYLLKAYLAAGAVAFEIAFTLGLSALGASIASAGVDLLRKYEGELQKVLGDVFDDAVGPAARWFAELANRLFGPPRCDGEVLRESFVFSPGQPRAERVTRDYQGPQHNSACGDPPLTEVSWWIERDGVPRYPRLAHAHVPGLIWALSPRAAHVVGRPEQEDTMVHDLLWYNAIERDGGVAWEGPRTLGYRWEFRQVFPGAGGTLYAITDDGTLAWYRNQGYRDGTWAWGRGRRDIAAGWNLPLHNPAPADLIGALCDTAMDVAGDLAVPPVDRPRAAELARQPAAGGVHDLGRAPAHDAVLQPAATDGQVIYALHADGSLWWHAHEGHATGDARWANAGQGRRLSGQWLAGNRRVFSGGLGVLYILKDDGSLRWVRHTGARTGEDTWLGGHAIAEGWRDMVNAFSIGAGRLFAIDRAGILWLYQHDGWASGETGLRDRIRVADGWARDGFAVAANTVATSRSDVR